MTNYIPDDQQNNFGESPRQTDRVYRTMNDDHRRTTQRSPLSRTSSWSAIFLMGGWRLALAIILIFFIVVNWALLGSRSSANSKTPATDVVAPTTLPQATMLPTMTMAISTAQVRVSGTGAAGLFLRKAPSRSAEVLKTLPDGTTLQIVGANKTVDDVVWRNVRDSNGVEGWVSAGYVVPVE